jgi:predicted transcriptional regulator
MSVTSVRLQPQIEQSLEAIAAKMHRSKNWIINQAIEDFVQKQEIEQQRWQDTLQALDAVSQGRVVSGDDVHSWLKSWGSASELPAPKKNP